MKKSLIISTLFVLAFSLALPSVFATTGEITIENNEFTLYRGNMITFPVTVEMSDYIHLPFLEITHNGDVTQKVSLRSIGDTFHGIIGLNENWSSGNYIINLTYQGVILDSESFVILRDNEVVSEIVIHENMSKDVEPFISLSTDKLILENYSHEIIYITGNLYNSQTGYFVLIDVTKPDGVIETIYASPSSDGTFSGLIPIDKHWIAGEYEVSATYLDDKTAPVAFTIQNNWETPIFTESQLVGSFEISSSVSHDYTILEVAGTIETDEPQVTLSVGKEDVTMYEDVILLDNGSFETSMVLYDYTTNTPWEYGEYQISGLIGEKSFHSKSFTLNEQSFTVPQIQSMDLFMKMKGEMQKMVDTFEVEINTGESQQVILSGNLDDYISGDPVTVHLISPDGADSESHLIASESGDYYMPIIVNDSWVSGQYTAYVTYGDFVDEPSSFSVINHAILPEDEIIDEVIVAVEDTVEIKNYSVSFSDTQSSSSVHYTANMESFSGKTPVTISLDDEVISESFTFSGDDGVIDYYLLLDSTWSFGNYTVSYIENETSIPFGTFEILDNSKSITDDTIDESNSEIIHTTLSLDRTVFKTSATFVDTVSFSGDTDYTGDISVLLDGEIISHTSANSNGKYGGIIFLSDKLDAGFHNVSVEYGEITESAEFLIATNDVIRLTEDVTISRDEILQAGGAITILVSGIMEDFVPSDISPVLIEISGDTSQQFSVMPKMYGHYLQNFVIDDTLGEYTVTVSYDGDILESHSINVVPSELSWVKSHTTSLINGEMNYVSYLKKAVLILDEPYAVHSDVSYPEWFAETAEMWVNGSMSDDSFYDAK